MVGAPAVEDAIERARLMPRLRVGLHLVLVEGRPVLSPQRLPDLVDASGRFRSDMVRLAFDIFARPAVRLQVAAEIEAQFKAFRATGLGLDHVNAHKHFHLHPTIAALVIAIGVRYGLRGLRVPIEPAGVLSAIEPSAARRWPLDPAATWAALLGRRARRAGLRSPDAVFGLAWSGAMTEPRFCGLLHHLSEGCTEIYMHPATGDRFEGHAPGYRYAEELAALTAPDAIAAARRADVALGGYSDF
jgi:hopanoid biosynthesis associated protein HpnK